MNSNIIISLFTLLILVSACKKKQNTLENELIHQDEGVISLTYEQFNQAALDTGKAQEIEFNESIFTKGYIKTTPNSKAIIAPVIGGYIKSTKVLSGDLVRKGSILFQLESPEYLKIQQDFLANKVELELNEAVYKRAENLAKENINSKKELQLAKSNYLKSKIEVKRLEELLGLLNIEAQKLSPENLSSSIHIASPISGYVNKVETSIGQFVETGQEICEIIDPSHLHLEVNIFEKDLSKVSVGQKILFTKPDNLEKIYSAELLHIAKEIDMHNKGIMVHGEIERAKSSGLIPGLYVEAEIVTSTIKGWGLPESAINNSASKYLVFEVFLSDSSIVLKPIEIEKGRSANGFVQVFSDKTDFANNLLLLNGSFYLNTVE